MGIFGKIGVFLRNITKILKFMKTINYRNVLASLLAIGLFLSGGFSSIASDQVLTVTLNSAPSDKTEYDVLPDEEGRRIPSRPIPCVISEDGISIPGLSETDILLYEIFDESEILIVSTTDQQVFLDFIFCYSGQLVIRLTLEDRCLIGCIDSVD